MSLRENIEQNFIRFSPKEKLVATYLLQENQPLKNISIQHLSTLTNVSPATITRFCRKIGCDSFVDLKIQLQASENTEQPIESEPIFSTVSQYYNRVLQKTADLLSETQLRRMIRLILEANRIVIYGVGSSGLTAREMAIRFSRMGINATCETDSHMMIISSTITTADDLVIGISNSGETKEVIHALTNAKRNQATVIAVSSINGGTLSQLANETLLVYNSRFVNNEQFVNSQFPISFLFDILTLMLLENPDYRRNMQKTIQEITQNH
ncbi:MurR/RpiR family transcriptional regulator [Aerococcaceae bacterium NML190938]|nr:MurR/RpiR family transcriptional regulator [Aerococcaceae bacterium NML190938]MCW6680766.1 MurR/RpiR family transcriptional regulator [Aerococcaceae bacterium NML130460]